MPTKYFTVYTPNPAFTGVRNCGRFSTKFEKGKAEVDEETAELFVKNFSYLCPELVPEHADTVEQIYVTGPADAEKARLAEEAEWAKDAEDAEAAEAEAGKIMVEFVAEHKIVKRLYAPGDRGVFKPEYARKLIDKGKARAL